MYPHLRRDNNSISMPARLLRLYESPINGLPRAAGRTASTAQQFFLRKREVQRVWPPDGTNPLLAARLIC